jgi:hypothetical protein
MKRMKKNKHQDQNTAVQRRHHQQLYTWSSGSVSPFIFWGHPIPCMEPWGITSSSLPLQKVGILKSHLAKPTKSSKDNDRALNEKD